ncbi:hypothetical protein LEP1GSC034_1013 [Leptospira interrogans str. 2003000735]|uniref:Uncharacterized protein n=2 Tax=Leptospira interrogans TaxID=173 RepID=A0A829D1Y8_LEPIR|nr:hypothetical protein [Leptospira interrogans]EMY06272.1 hypothetical protein LEP1GSC029_3150 [Leptospira interrogans str. 2002000626]EMY25675.1 hypothetical protein LEP1GSC115_1481 [Leptospira interrogans serovar Australis str. 200703203]EKN89812.1 hypothetical protein LEP1GSC027_3964 [Leptospira interrogans str. 2002000624]EKQ40172.1 hypothetical protein LEP1GSC025_2159 [Leptospira interrogans str. 2002000621]EKQ46057.1 hypothetical protein LEP1GSC026_3157 [Leptospira interrogans str. 2002
MTHDRALKLIATIEDGSVEEQEMLIQFLDDIDGKFEDCDMNLVRKFSILSHLFGGMDLSESSWRFFPLEISSGKYPLDKLPEYVRGIAKELYYK